MTTADRGGPARWAPGTAAASRVGCPPGAGGGPRGAAARVGTPAVALLASLVAVVTAACVSIPDSGPVVANPAAEAGVEALSVIPADPPDGAGPQEIVEGFLAATGAFDGFVGARRYLTEDMVRRWDPGPLGRFLVYRPPHTVTMVGDEQASVAVEVVAEIDEDGRYTARPAGQSESQTMQLRRDGSGEWRISELPDDVLVSSLAVERALRPYPLYFGADGAGGGDGVLVPDIRWLPARSDSAGLLVDALLDGPSSPLFESVENGAAGLELTDRRVSVADEIATVDFTDSYLATGRDVSRAGRLLQAQLTASLGQLPGVREVRVTVDGQVVDTPAPLTLDTQPSERGRPYVLLLRPTVGSAAPTTPSATDPPTPGETPDDPVPDEAGSDDLPLDGTTSADGAASAPGVVAGPAIGLLGPSDASPITVEPGVAALAARIEGGLAVSGDAQLFAGLAEDGETLLTQARDGAVRPAVEDGRQLTTPSIDPHGWLWTGSRDLPADVARVGPEGAVVLAVPPTRGSARAVPVQWRDGVPDRVVAARVSRDGTRVLLAVEQVDGGVAVQVRGIVRDAAGRPLRLSAGAYSLLPDLVAVDDAAWVSADTIVVLGEDDAGGTVAVAQVGGAELSEIEPPPGIATSVSAGSGERQIAIGTEDGIVYQRAGTGWLPVAEATSPAY